MFGCHRLASNLCSSTENEFILIQIEVNHKPDTKPILLLTGVFSHFSQLPFLHLGVFNAAQPLIEMRPNNQ
jgi:hypothetical protein